MEKIEKRVAINKNKKFIKIVLYMKNTIKYTIKPIKVW